jgi:hypothetical protein
MAEKSTAEKLKDIHDLTPGRENYFPNLDVWKNEPAKEKPWDWLQIGFALMVVWIVLHGLYQMISG